MSDRLVGITCILALMVLISTHVAESQAVVAKHNPTYIKALENIVTACLSDSTGKPIQIDEDWYLCGIVKIH